MFEFHKEVLNKVIEEDLKKYRLESDKKDELLNEMKHLTNYQDICRQIKTYTVQLGISLTVVISLIVIGIGSGKELAYLFTLFPFVNSINSVFEIKNNKNKKKNTKYKNYLELTKEELAKTEKDLNRKAEIIDCNMKGINDKIQENNNALKHFNKYVSYNEFFNTPVGIMLTAKTKEEYQKMYSQYQTSKNNSFDDYLNEKVDYSTIHFESSIEECKKLVKKM